MEDSFLHKGLRRKLVENLRKKGINNEQVLEAIGRVPRHYYMDSGFVNQAYEDKPFPIGAGQTISQPYTVAFQTQLLDVQKWDRVLEIGTGSGYQTAVLIEMGAKVFTIERQQELYRKTKLILPKMGYHPDFFFGDGYEGKPVLAPFDKILITCGAPEIPPKLLPQLAVGGRMVVPVGETDKQIMYLIERVSEKEFKKTEHGDFIFVPMLGGMATKG